MKTLTVAYVQRTCKTGFALYKALKASRKFRWVKRTYNRSFDERTDVLLRWGSSEEFPLKQTCIEINSKDAVSNASVKETMLRLLNEEQEVSTPKVLFLKNTTVTPELLEEYRHDGNFYVRGSNMEVRYDNTTKVGDVYLTKPIQRAREFRVQVFNDKIVKMYEKVPNEEGQTLMKSWNCHFSRIDTERFNKKALEMCIKGVKKLGLITGGCDLIKDVDNKYYINEINSGFGLNNPNIELYRDLIIEYVYNR